MKRNLFFAILCLLLLVITLRIFWPGTYTVDSWNHYGQMMTGNYHDWHSPLMPFIWRVLYRLTHKFSCMYLLEMSMYWFFIFLLLKESRNIVVAIVILLLAMVCIFIPQTVMKDGFFALSWAIAFVFLIMSAQYGQAWLKWLILPLIIFGLWLRPNTIIAIMPALYIFTERYLAKNAGRAKKLAITVLLSGILVGGYFVFAYKILNAASDYPQYKIKLLDVTGISKVSGTDYMPACITSSQYYNRDSVYSLYHPASFDQIYWPPSGNHFVPEASAGYNDCITAAWKKAILAHPLIYLRNRYEGFLYYLRIKKRFARADYWDSAYYIDPNNQLGLTNRNGPAARKFVTVWDSLKQTVFYEPWFWLLLNCIFLILFMFRLKRTGYYPYKVLAFLQLSGILYTLSQFPVYQHDRDFRYNYWNVFVFFIGFAYFFGRSIRHSRSVGKKL